VVEDVAASAERTFARCFLCSGYDLLDRLALKKWAERKIGAHESAG
jgi:hypothetical protein